MPLAVARTVATILLVDDDPGVRYALTEVLRDHGYRVIAVDSGARALAALDGDLDRIDVVVTDLSMPGMDGLELSLVATPVLTHAKHHALEGLHDPVRCGSAARPSQKAARCRSDRAFEAVGHAARAHGDSC